MVVVVVVGGKHDLVCVCGHCHAQLPRWVGEQPRRGLVGGERPSLLLNMCILIVDGETTIDPSPAVARRCPACVCALLYCVP